MQLILFADDLKPYRAFPGPYLVKIGKVNPAEFAQFQFTVIDGYGLGAPEEDRADVRVSVQTP